MVLNDAAPHARSALPRVHDRAIPYTPVHGLTLSSVSGTGRQQRLDGANSITEDDVRTRLSSELQSLTQTGLADDEAFLIAVRRLAVTDPAARAFAREHFAELWDGSEIEPEMETASSTVESEATVGDSSRIAASVAPVLAARGLGQSGFWVMAAFAFAAAVAVKVPELFGLELGDNSGGNFYARNLSLLVLPALVGWLVWKKRSPRWVVGALAGAFAVSAVVVNAYPLEQDGFTVLLVAIHLPVLLWLTVGLAFAGQDWRASERRMDFARFSGEWFVWYVLIALGGGVFTTATVWAVWAIGMDAAPFAQWWLLPCGAAGAVVVSAWLADQRDGAVSSAAPVLSRIFTPLFGAMLIVLLFFMQWRGRTIAGDREVLIFFNVLTALVLALLLYSASARQASARPGSLDLLSAVLAAAALITDALVLAVLVDRLADFGWSPNRAAVLGMNLILLVNLAGTVWLYAALWRRRRPFTDIVRWQTAHFGVYAAWAAIVVMAFPPIFGFD